jgi:hypothetical protein
VSGRIRAQLLLQGALANYLIHSNHFPCLILLVAFLTHLSVSMPAQTQQPVIYLCNGFGHVDGQRRYKSIAAFYKSFDKDFLNTAEVEDRTEQKPYIEADVKANDLQTWEGSSLGQFSYMDGSLLSTQRPVFLTLTVLTC